MKSKSNDLRVSIHLLERLVEFVESQEKEGLIDGACDPSIYVQRAKQLIKKHAQEYGGNCYALMI